MFRPNYQFLSTAALCCALAACSNVPRFFNEYKIDIQQGNVLSQEMVAQLKPGQTRDQVRFVLGTPLIADVFHQQRWDYVYRFHNGATGQAQSRRFSVYFDNEGLLSRVDGDVAEATVLELTAPVVRSRVVDLGSMPESGTGSTLPPPEAPSYYRRFMDLIGF
jgi:outer membrane protein assembly factor BamE